MRWNEWMNERWAGSVVCEDENLFLIPASRFSATENQFAVMKWHVLGQNQLTTEMTQLKILQIGKHIIKNKGTIYDSSVFFSDNFFFIFYLKNDTFLRFSFIRFIFRTQIELFTHQRWPEFSIYSTPPPTTKIKQIYNLNNRSRLANFAI